jgi:signal transduction histidine kinase
LTAARALLEMVITDPHASVETFRETCRHVLQENEQQEQLIDALLSLAQGQRGLGPRERINLDAVVTGEVQRQEGDAAARGLQVELSLEPALISGDQRLVRRLVSNLLENAIRHNTQHGEVRVAVEAQAGSRSSRSPTPASGFRQMRSTGCLNLSNASHQTASDMATGSVSDCRSSLPSQTPTTPPSRSSPAQAEDSRSRCASHTRAAMAR